MSHAALEAAIEAAWEARDGLTPSTKARVRDAIEATLTALDSGTCGWPKSAARTGM
jgi:2,3,4,5-tetrahydropyridine-2,6-dicarboxylate N-succinyltransferase